MISSNYDNRGNVNTLNANSNCSLIDFVSLIQTLRIIEVE